MEQLQDSEYQSYGRQYQMLQRIVAVYESEPDNFPRIFELMQDIQQYGQPPAEIIKQLAPHLQFDKSGVPILPNLAGNMMPDTAPGMPGMPLPDPSQCAQS